MTVAVSSEAPAATNVPQQQNDRYPRILDVRLWQAWTLIVLLAWGFLAATGVTTSSVGLFNIAEGETGIVAGNPKTVRGDEFARWSPLWMGMETDGDTSFTTPLGSDPFLSSALPSQDVVEFLVFPDRGLLALGPILDDGPLFALVFWFPVAMVAIFLPYLLLAWGARAGPALAATGLVILSPSTVWWSWLPMFSMVPGLIASAALVTAVRARTRAGVIWAVVAVVIGGLAAARTPWSYAPWALVLSGGLFGITALTLFSRRGWRLRTLLVALGIGVVAALATLWVLVANEAAFEAFGNTVYPGRREFAGAALPVGIAFGAPLLGVLQSEPPIIGNTNYSEISTTWNIAVIAWLGLALGAWRRIPGWARVHMVAAGAVLAVTYSWFLVDWPVALGQSIPLLNLVASTRMSAIAGIFALCGAAVLVSLVQPRWWLLMPAVALTAVVTVAAGADLSTTYLPVITLANIAFAAAVTTAAAAFALASWSALRYLGFVIALAGAVAITYAVGPVQEGLGALRGSQAALAVLALEQESSADRPQYWAADTPEFSALLTANGVPSLSGDMWAGPTDRWRELDPSGAQESAWNRGASNIRFSWNSEQPNALITNPVADIITVEISPCATALDRFDLRFVVSASGLAESCLTPIAEVPWNGTNYTVYERAR